MSDDLGELDITAADWIRDLDATRRATGSPRAPFTAEADAALIHLRAGPSPVFWSKIQDAFRSRGWPASRETLTRRLAELRAEAKSADS